MGSGVQGLELSPHPPQHCSPLRPASLRAASCGHISFQGGNKTGGPELPGLILEPLAVAPVISLRPPHASDLVPSYHPPSSTFL